MKRMKRTAQPTKQIRLHSRLTAGMPQRGSTQLIQNIN
jgi:hypothetical protein